MHGSPKTTTTAYKREQKHAGNPRNVYCEWLRETCGFRTCVVFPVVIVVGGGLGGETRRGVGRGQRHNVRILFFLLEADIRKVCVYVSTCTQKGSKPTPSRMCHTICFLTLLWLHLVIVSQLKALRICSEEPAGVVFIPLPPFSLGGLRVPNDRTRQIERMTRSPKKP